MSQIEGVIKRGRKGGRLFLWRNSMCKDLNVRKGSSPGFLSVLPLGQTETGWFFCLEFLFTSNHSNFYFIMLDLIFILFYFSITI